MKVWELIERLQGMDPDARVRVVAYNEFGERTVSAEVAEDVALRPGPNGVPEVVIS